MSRRNSRQRILLGALGLMWLGQSCASPFEDYVLHCMGCHGSQAEGVPGKIPPLAHSLGHFLRSAEGRNYVLRVPGAANSALSDEQLAAVLNWLLAEFNSEEVPRGSLPFTAAELQTWRRKPLPGVLATRQSIVSTLAASGAAPAAHY